MSESQPPEEAVGSGSLFDDEAAPKGRSPIERVIVWGLILALLGTAGFEYFASQSYASACADLEDAVKATLGGEPLKLSEARQILGGVFRESEMFEVTAVEREVEFTWSSVKNLWTDPAEFHVKLRVEKTGDDPLVTRLSIPVGDVNGTYEEFGADIGRILGPGEGAPSTATTPGVGGDGAGGSGGGGPNGGGFGGPQGAFSPGGGGSAGGGPGGGRGRRRRPLNSMIALIANDAVRKEIGLTDGQIEKLADIAAKARPNFQELRQNGFSFSDLPKLMADLQSKAEAGLKELLEEEQFNRLREITLQKIGAVGLDRGDVQEALGLSADQVKTIKDLMGKRQDALQKLGFMASREKRDEATKPIETQLMETLEDAQKEAWDGLLGEVFEIPQEDGGEGGGRPSRPAAE